MGVMQYLQHAGPRCRGRSCRSGRNGRNPSGVPVFAWKGETLEEYGGTLQALTWEDGEGPTLIVDDGGDATLLIHLGKEHEEAGTLPDPASTDNAEEKVIFEIIRAVRAEKGDILHRDGKGPRSVRRDHNRRHASS